MKETVNGRGGKEIVRGKGGSLLTVLAALWQSLAKALPCVKLFVF